MKLLQKRHIATFQHGPESNGVKLLNSHMTITLQCIAMVRELKNSVHYLSETFLPHSTSWRAFYGSVVAQCRFSTSFIFNSYQHKFDLRGDLEKKEVEELKDGNNGNAECEAIDATKVRKEHFPRVTDLHNTSLFLWGKS